MWILDLGSLVWDVWWTKLYFAMLSQIFPKYLLSPSFMYYFIVVVAVAIEQVVVVEVLVVVVGAAAAAV